MKTGIELLMDERNRQITEEGYTHEHDSQHNSQEFIGAAIAYAVASLRGASYSSGLKWWPWEETGFKPSMDERRNLVKAGALIAAAIDRLQTDIEE